MRDVVWGFQWQERDTVGFHSIKNISACALAVSVFFTRRTMRCGKPSDKGKLRDLAIGVTSNG